MMLNHEDIQEKYAEYILDVEYGLYGKEYTLGVYPRVDANHIFRAFLNDIDNYSTPISMWEDELGNYYLCVFAPNEEE